MHNLTRRQLAGTMTGLLLTLLLAALDQTIVGTAEPRQATAFAERRKPDLGDDRAYARLVRSYGERFRERGLAAVGCDRVVVANWRALSDDQDSSQCWRSQAGNDVQADRATARIVQG